MLFKIIINYGLSVQCKQNVYIFVTLKLKTMKKELNYVIVRSVDAGVFFGKLKDKQGKEATLDECRKLYYWDGAAAVEQLAVNGTVAPDNCKFTVTVNDSTIMGVCQILPCTDKAVKSIKAVKEWKR